MQHFRSKEYNDEQDRNSSSPLNTCSELRNTPDNAGSEGHDREVQSAVGARKKLQETSVIGWIGKDYYSAMVNTARVPDVLIFNGQSGWTHFP